MGKNRKRHLIVETTFCGADLIANELHCLLIGKIRRDGIDDGSIGMK